jgi:hypothetical protein
VKRLPMRRATMWLLFGVVCVLGNVAPALGAEGPGPNSLNGLDATYDARANIYWNQRKLSVSSTAHVTNNSDAAVDALTFNVAPAKIGDLELRGARVGPDAVNAHVQDQNVIVSLPVPLEVGGPTRSIRRRTASPS